MPKMNIVRSIVINAPASDVFKKLNNFNEWTPWSPWLIMEAEAKVTVAPDAKSYEWEGSRVGAGNMKILEERENEFIDYDLIFLKPWKSKARTAFKLETEGDNTKVTWTMDSSMPWFLFWMVKMTEAFVGSDYERGLNMLKAYVETGSIPSKLEFMGSIDFEGCQYVGVHTSCSFEDIGIMMAEDFEKLSHLLGDDNEEVNGHPFTIYHDWNMVKRTIKYTSALPMKSIPADLPSGFVKGEIPGTKTYQLRHVGPYEYIGNAWSTLYTMHRNKEFKMNKKIDPFETYRNDPRTTPKEELIADINFPMK